MENNKASFEILVGLDLRHVQSQRFVPFRIERCLDGFGLFLDVIRVRNEASFDVRIRQSVGIHRDQVLALANFIFFCMAQRQSQNRMKQHKIFHLDSCGYLVICVACTERNIFSFFLIRTRPCGLFPGIKSHFPNKRGETLLSGSVRRRRGRLKYKNRLAEFNDKWNSSKVVEIQ
jgi:hypothetical protein